MKTDPSHGQLAVWGRPDGMTPLVLAAAMDHEALAIILREKGANLNVKDIFGQTPWNMAMAILSEGSLLYEKLDVPHSATTALLVKFGAIPVLAKDLPPPPESVKGSFYFRRQKGVSGGDEDGKSTSAQH